MEEFLHAQQLIRLFFFKLEERNAGHLGNDIGYVFFSNRRLVFFLVLLPLTLGFIKEFTQPFFFLAMTNRFLEVLHRDGLLFFARNLLQLLLHRLQL